MTEVREADDRRPVWRSTVGAIVFWLWRLVVLLGFGGSARGCSAEVDVDSAEVSRDDLRLRLRLQICNPDTLG